jgi:hypothetical protein
MQLTYPLRMPQTESLASWLLVRIEESVNDTFICTKRREEFDKEVCATASHVD